MESCENGIGVNIFAQSDIMSGNVNFSHFGPNTFGSLSISAGGKPNNNSEAIKKDVETNVIMLSDDEESQEYVEQESSDEEERQDYVEQESSDEEMDEKTGTVTTKEIVKEIMECGFTFKGLNKKRNGSFIIKDEDVEIVKKEMKCRYNRYLGETLENVERMEECIPQLISLRKQFAISEVKLGEMRANKEAKRLVKMIVVTGDAEVFAKY